MNGIGAVGFASTAVSSALVIGAVFLLLAFGWDSGRWNPIGSTHSLFTGWAIDPLKSVPRTPAVPQADHRRREPGVARVEGQGLEVRRQPRCESDRGTRGPTKDVTTSGVGGPTAATPTCTGDKTGAYFLLGIMLHMIQDMGVPAHANRVHHQASLTGLDHFEIMAFLNWRPALDAIDRDDPAYPEPWKYYEFSGDWTRADAPDYRSRTQFSRTWTFARPEERELLRNRQGRTYQVTRWALQKRRRGVSWDLKE